MNCVFNAPYAEPQPAIVSCTLYTLVLSVYGTNEPLPVQPVVASRKN